MSTIIHFFWGVCDLWWLLLSSPASTSIGKLKVSCFFSVWLFHVRLGHGFKNIQTDGKKSMGFPHLYGSIPINSVPFLVGWTSIYQLFWCSPGVQGFDTLPYTFMLFYRSVYMVISPLNIGIYTNKKNWDFTIVTSWGVLSYMCCFTTPNHSIYHKSS